MLINKMVIQEEEDLTSRSKSSQRLPPNKHVKSSPFSKKSSINDSNNSRPRLDISSRMLKDNQSGFAPLSPYQFVEGIPQTSDTPDQSEGRELPSQVSFKAIVPPESTSPVQRQQRLQQQHTRSGSKLAKMKKQRQSPGKDIEDLLEKLHTEEQKVARDLQLKEQQMALQTNNSFSNYINSGSNTATDQEKEGIDPETGRMRRLCCKNSQKRLQKSNESILSQRESRKQLKQGLQTQRNKSSQPFFQQVIDKSFTSSVQSSLSSDQNETVQDDEGLVPNRRQTTPQKVYSAFRAAAKDYRMGFPDDEELEPIDLDNMQEQCKRMWNFDTEELYNPQSSVTYDVYVDNMARTLTALISQRTSGPFKINLGNRKPVKKMQVQITSINQNKFKRTKEGHAWGYGYVGKHSKVEPSLRKLLDRSSPHARNSRFPPGSNTMENVLQAIVPEIVKKSPKPSTFEDALIACCRRKQKVDKNGCIVALEDGANNLRLQTLNQQSAMWSEMGPTDMLENAMDIERISTILGSGDGDAHLSAKRTSKNGPKSIVTKQMSRIPQYYDDRSQWHKQLEQSMRKFEHYEAQPDSIYRANLREGQKSPTDSLAEDADSHVPEIKDLDKAPQLKFNGKTAKILDSLSDSDEEMQACMKRTSGGPSRASPEFKPPKNKQQIVENPLQKSRTTVESSGKFSKNQDKQKRNKINTEDVIQEMENDDDKHNYRQNLIDIKNKWESLEERVLRATQSRFDSRLELEKVIMKEEPVEGRKIVNKKTSNTVNSTASNGPSIETATNATAKRSPFLRKNVSPRTGKGAVTSQAKKKGSASPIKTRSPVKMYELSAPVFPGGPPKNLFRTINHDKRTEKKRNKGMMTVTRTTGLSPFTNKNKTRAQLPQSLQNNNNILNMDSAASESAFDGPKSIRLLQNKNLSNTDIDNSGRKSTRKELPKLRVSSKFDTDSAGSPTRKALAKDRTHMKNLALREIYHSAKRGVGRRVPNRDLSYEIAQPTPMSLNPTESLGKPGTFNLPKEAITHEQLMESRLSVGKTSSVFMRPTFDQVCEIDRAAALQKTYASQFTTPQSMFDTEQPLTTKFGYTGMWEKTDRDNKITSMDQHMVGSGDNFFPNNISTALVQQKISFGAKEDFKLAGKNFDGDSIGASQDFDGSPYDRMLEEMEATQNSVGRVPFDVTVTTTNNFRDTNSRYSPLNDIENDRRLFPDAPKMIVRDEASQKKLQTSSYNPQKIKDRIAQIRNKMKKTPTIHGDHSFVTLMDQKQKKPDLYGTTLNKDSQNISAQGISLPDFISKAFTRNGALETSYNPIDSKYNEPFHTTDETFTGYVSNDKVKPQYTFRQFEKDTVTNRTNYILPSLNRYQKLKK